jgi:hypothetical protein
MESKEEIREDQKEITRDILERVGIISFSVNLAGPNKGCNMSNIDGSCGYVTINDALKKDWKIYDYKTDSLLGDFDNLDEIFKAGWTVST